jgi:hypothetical protein
MLQSGMNVMGVTRSVMVNLRSPLMFGRASDLTTDSAFGLPW